MASSAAARGGAGSVRNNGPPPPPPGRPPRPSQSPSMQPPRAPAADWLRPRFNAFEPQEPAVGVVAHFWDKFFLSEHDEELWRAALLADIDGVKKIIDATDASVFIPPSEMEVVDDAGNSMELPPTRFRRWSLRMYVILQRMLLGQTQPMDEDLDERYERILEFLDDQENLVVVQLSTEMSEKTEDGVFFQISVTAATLSVTDALPAQWRKSSCGRQHWAKLVMNISLGDCRRFCRMELIL